MDEPILKVENLKVEFNDHTVLDKISFEVKRDSTLAVIGPNGAGKSVLFRSILNLIPYEGKISWSKDARIGYVPQKLFIEKDLPLTVREFLGFKEKNKEKISQALESVGFLKESTHLHNDKRVLATRMGNLSGGEMQRVLIAYALLGNPNVLLFDEPTAGVDIAGEETVYSLINKLKEKADLTIIFISHELEIVRGYADSVLCLNKEKICFGPPSVINKDAIEKMYGEEAHIYHHQL
jgi:zinc transport system ATP-binding protein